MKEQGVVFFSDCNWQERAYSCRSFLKVQSDTNMLLVKYGWLSSTGHQKKKNRFLAFPVGYCCRLQFNRDVVAN